MFYFLFFESLFFLIEFSINSPVMAPSDPITKSQMTSIRGSGGSRGMGFILYR